MGVVHEGAAEINITKRDAKVAIRGPGPGRHSEMQSTTP